MIPLLIKILKNQNNVKGFTIVELMISAAVSGFLVLALAGVLSQIYTNINKEESFSNYQIFLNQLENTLEYTCITNLKNNSTVLSMNEGEINSSITSFTLIKNKQQLNNAISNEYKINVNNANDIKDLCLNQISYKMLRKVEDAQVGGFKKKIILLVLRFTKKINNACPQSSAGSGLSSNTSTTFKSIGVPFEVLTFQQSATSEQILQCGRVADKGLLGNMLATNVNNTSALTATSSNLSKPQFMAKSLGFNPNLITNCQPTNANKSLSFVSHNNYLITLQCNQGRASVQATAPTSNGYCNDPAYKNGPSCQTQKTPCNSTPNFMDASYYNKWHDSCQVSTVTTSVPGGCQQTYTVNSCTFNGDTCPIIGGINTFTIVKSNPSQLYDQPSLHNYVASHSSGNPSQDFTQVPEVDAAINAYKNKFSNFDKYIKSAGQDNNNDQKPVTSADGTLYILKFKDVFSFDSSETCVKANGSTSTYKLPSGFLVPATITPSSNADNCLPNSGAPYSAMPSQKLLNETGDPVYQNNLRTYARQLVGCAN